jgi:hypothetical protein
MLAALVATLVAAGPVSLMSEAQIDDKIAEAHKLPFSQRIDELSKLFLGTDYGEFPLGDGSGPEPWPRWRTDKVDCQTYVETVLAMANARNLQEAQSVLDDIRYGKPQPTFENRNHFTEAQWLPANTGKGYLKDEVPIIDGRAPTETLTLSKAQWTKVKVLQRLVNADVPEGKFTVRYLPLQEAKKRARSIEPGTILMVVREHDPNRIVRISHMGFVLKDSKGGYVVRHASTGDAHAVVDEQLADFLDKQASYKKWKVVGFAMAMPLDASLRVSQIATASR